MALPFAYFAARMAPKRPQAWLFVIVLIPLWSSYLVPVYAWRLILAKDGILNWALHQIGFGSVNVAYSNWSVWIAFSYIWLPFMILPVWTAIERVPDSFLEASGGSRRARLDDVPACPVSTDPAWDRRRLDLHLRSDPR